MDYQEYENPAAEWADIIADNKIAELSDPDDKLIKEILDEIKGKIDLDLTGYAGVQMDQLLKDIRRHDKQYQQGSLSKEKLDLIDNEIEAMVLSEDTKAIFEGKNNIIVPYSGGIDSTFALFWAKQNFPDKKIYGIFSDPGVELPGMALHTYQVCMHLGVEHILVKPKYDMFIEMVKKGNWLPTVFHECQHKFVYTPINDWITSNLDANDTVILTGSRQDQANVMSNKTQTSGSKEERMQAYKCYAPGFNIDRDVIIKILKKANVPLWDGYDKGFMRTAC